MFWPGFFGKTPVVVRWTPLAITMHESTSSTSANRCSWPARLHSGGLLAGRQSLERREKKKKKNASIPTFATSLGMKQIHDPYQSRHIPILAQNITLRPATTQVIAFFLCCKARTTATSCRTRAALTSISARALAGKQRQENEQLRKESWPGKKIMSPHWHKLTVTFFTAFGATCVGCGGEREQDRDRSQECSTACPSSPSTSKISLNSSKSDVLELEGDAEDEEERQSEEDIMMANQLRPQQGTKITGSCSRLFSVVLPNMKLETGRSYRSWSLQTKSCHSGSVIQSR